MNLSHYKPILRALPTINATIQQQTRIVEKVWKDVEKISVSNEQDKQRREIARGLISRDKHFQENKIAALYAKMSEGLKLKKISQVMQS